ADVNPAEMDTRKIDGEHDKLEPAIHLADDVIVRNETVVERELTEFGTAPSDLADVAHEVKARVLLVDDEQREAAVQVRGRIRDRYHDHPVGDVDIGNEALAAVEHPSAVGLLRARL